MLKKADPAPKFLAVRATKWEEYEHDIHLSLETTLNLNLQIIVCLSVVLDTVLMMQGSFYKKAALLQERGSSPTVLPSCIKEEWRRCSAGRMGLTEAGGRERQLCVH